MRTAAPRRLLQHYGPAALLALLTLAVWETVARLGLVPPFILPAPSAVWMALMEDRHLLFGVHLPATLLEVLTGFALSVVCGSLLGIAMHLFRPLAKALYPLLIISQTVPLIALSPLFIMWFGYTLWSKVAVVFLTAFFPVVIGTYDGLSKNTDAYRELLLTYGANRWQILGKVSVPLALPSFSPD